VNHNHFLAEGLVSMWLAANWAEWWLLKIGEAVEITFKRVAISFPH
jgi:hypothetical protein